MRVTYPNDKVWRMFSRRFRDTFWAGFRFRDTFRNMFWDRFWDRFYHENELTK